MPSSISYKFHINCILSCLVAYTLAQPKVKIGNISIPEPIPNSPRHA